MIAHKYKMEIERFRFAIATKDMETALFNGSADMVLWHEGEGDEPSYMEAFYTEGDPEEPFSQKPVLQYIESLAQWWLGKRWRVLEARLEGDKVVGHAEEAGKEAMHECA